MTLSVLRGSARIEVKAPLAEEPRLVREADRMYFEKIGFTAREFVYGDAIARHSKATELSSRASWRTW
jgi:serine protease Do